MGKHIESDKVVLLFDSYSADSHNLFTSFKLAGKKYPAVVIEDDGFLPEGVTSVYGFFLGNFAGEEGVPGKPRYFNQITVPEYWEISGNNNSGKIHDMNKERGRIFYATPTHKRLVKIVDWYDENGIVRCSDHYNKYGALYARTIFNEKGQRINKSYFSARGNEIITENFVTRNIILNDGDVVRIFRSKQEFTCFFMERAGYANHRIFFNTLSTSFFVSQSLAREKKEDVLFWQEPVGAEIPGNMKAILSGENTRTAKIMVQKRDAYDKLLQLGAPESIVKKLGYVYPYKRYNSLKREVLICTNSDRIEQCEYLAEALPDMHFHIVALTEMSAKLMAMGNYKNVSLYPAAKMQLIDELFRKCDYYLDINHESEIVSAVRKAFLHSHLILAFRETLHNATYVAEEHVFPSAEPEKMVALLKAVKSDEALMQQHLKTQRAFALSEKKEAYLNI